MQREFEWLIVGAGGQLGQAVQKELSKREINFLAFTSSQLDVRDHENVRTQIALLRPNIIVNCAGWTDVQGAEMKEDVAIALNAFAIENIVKIANGIGSKVVQISSDYVFSGDKNLPYEESDPMNPINAYGRSKALGEHLISKLNESPVYVLRTAWLHSEFGTNFVKSILRKYLTSELPIRVVNDQFGNPTSATDLAYQIVESVNNEIPFGTYHAVNTSSASWYDLSRYSLEYLGLDTNKLVGVASDESESHVNRPKNSSLGTSKWSQTNVPEMRNWKIALQDTIQNIYVSVEREVQNDFRKNGN